LVAWGIGVKDLDAEIAAIVPRLMNGSNSILDSNMSLPPASMPPMPPPCSWACFMNIGISRK
jgi:hypothetical protein